MVWGRMFWWFAQYDVNGVLDADELVLSYILQDCS